MPRVCVCRSYKATSSALELEGQNQVSRIPCHHTRLFVFVAQSVSIDGLSAFMNKSTICDVRVGYSDRHVHSRRCVSLVV
eukprot:42063-Eustigmatos_ZCMA.PRE.1